MSSIKPLADASDRVANVEQRDFGFQESWLREFERARAGLLGHASSPGEQSPSPPANPDSKPPPAIPLIALTSVEPSSHGVPRGAEANKTRLSQTVDRPADDAASDPREQTHATQPNSRDVVTAPKATLVEGESPQSAAPIAPAGVALAASSHDSQSPNSATARTTTPALASDSGDAVMVAYAQTTPQIEGALAATSENPSDLVVASPVATAIIDSPAPSIATRLDSPAIVSARLDIASAPAVPVEARGVRTLPQSSTSARLPAERADPAPRSRIHVQVGADDASVWVRDASLDPAQSQGLLGRMAAQIALAGRRLRSFAVNGRVIVGPARAARPDATEARDNPIQQARR